MFCWGLYCNRRASTVVCFLLMPLSLVLRLNINNITKAALGYQKALCLSLVLITLPSPIVQEATNYYQRQLERLGFFQGTLRGSLLYL